HLDDILCILGRGCFAKQYRF
ncbi:hypothetical protein A5834_000831, partial [Enterococcus faecium]